jgi:predicted transcriptional regulator of viral defense system
MDFLSMKTKFEELGFEIFTLNDAIKLTNQNEDVVKNKLSRLIKQKKIYSLKKMYYSFKKINNKFKLQKTFNDTYIGLYSALEYYESTTQRFNNLDLITKKLKNSQKINDFEINFHKVKKNMFFGYKKYLIENTEIFVSNIEKTIIDCVYFSNKIYLSETLNFIKKNKKNIDVNLLKEYLDKINSLILNKRIGYLLEKQGINIKKLKINNKYEKLNRNLSFKGIKNKKWKLIINEEL